MGKASSAKKVARVAKVGGKSTKKRRNLGFPILVVALLGGGVLAVWAARSNVTAEANTFPKAAINGSTGDHIHMAYAINDCGKWLAPIPTFESTYGIHTHGDGVLHIHPFTASAAGKNATFSVFENGAGMTSSPSGLHYTGVTVKGDCNGKPAVLRVAEWNTVVDKNHKQLAHPKISQIYTKDFGKIRLDHNGGALTFFYGSPTATDIPVPPSIPAMITALGGDDSAITPTTVAGATSTTVKGTATTVKGTATTVAPSTTASAN